MSFVRQSIPAALAVVMIAACTSPTDHSQSAQPVITALPRSLSTQEQIAATATTDFGLSLFRSVALSLPADSSLALSPVSASLALGMALNATEGQTMSEIRSALGFGTRAVSEVNTAYRTLVPLLTSVDPSVTMKFANSAWFDTGSPASATFMAAINDGFGAKTTTLPFSAPSTLKAMNDWASANTNGRIPKILEFLDPSMVAVLMNATYFKGKWREQFDPAQTKPLPFHVSASKTVQVPTMFAKEGLVRAAVASGGTLVAEMPYGGDAFVMDIVMPAQDQMQAELNALTPARWRQLIAALPDSATSVPLYLPKFRLETMSELKEDLRGLGMSRIFMPGVAETAPMFASGRPDASVSSVLQRVFVDVNEEGTEAAAVTAIIFDRTSVGPPRDVVIDRPFLFVIRERLSGTILFLGKVMTPVAPTAP